jgi:ATP-dependent helicase/nuclease subunit B
MIDRIDRATDGLRVVDYKTGRAGARYATSGDPYKGGRTLQHALYGLVAELLYGEGVTSAEYHFPARVGESAQRAFPTDALGSRERVLNRLLDIARAGAFLPTEDAKDCRWCDFAEVCRVSQPGPWNTVSPLTEWAKERIESAEEYAPLYELRQGATDDD